MSSQAEEFEPLLPTDGLAASRLRELKGELE